MAVNRAMMENVRESIQQNAAKAASPFTATTGDKAKTIIREMLAGHKIIYRRVGYNQAASTDGEVLIDESFLRALNQIGITREMLEK